MTRAAPGAWALFVDWCTATGRRPLPARPADISAFLTQVPSAPSTKLGRVRAIRAEHERAGLVPPLRATHDVPPPGPSRAGSGWLDPAEAIARCSPGSIRDRRDAVIVMAHQMLGLTARQVASARTPPAAWEVAGAPLTSGQDVCPRCVLARWLVVHRELVPHGSRGGAQHVVRHAGEGHVCQGPVPAVEPGAPLLVALDRHGLPGQVPISARTVARVCAARMSLDAPAARTRPLVPFDREQVGRELDELLARLDEAVALMEASVGAHEVR